MCAYKCTCPSRPKTATISDTNGVSLFIPVCGGVVGDLCVGGGVEVGRTTDVELPSGEPVEDETYRVEA